MDVLWAGLQVWDAQDGTRCLSLLTGGKIIALVPNDRGMGLAPGWYDFDLNPLPDPFADLVDLRDTSAPSEPPMTFR